ncbi:McrBC 5-methylcytosine restriction system component-like protein [Novosphingobium aromaticivorans DSM 12444]|uniref:McrBC 5-methylcytosine restriction system component-like protein n=2 Tax=Novosphingobium aromaticivorans TaxID=48935 RepID=Q2GBH5_NOVAD|nr:McrBC 5-methylcytosine restriction system component-like protein [Novosphingobium aromaticivorans DSM 12444]SCY17282.1 5-methylcytosine-specific restriction enzyme subunit McrC [Novosphingobium aromaticivorans]
MLAEMAYSRADEAAGASNPSAIDLSGSFYANLSACRAAARAYFRFCNSEARPQGRFGELDREAVLEAVAACDAVGDVAQYVADLDLGQPTRYWLVLDGKRYPSKAVVRDALARRGSDWLPGGGECKTALERLGFVVIDWPELNRARDAFLRQMPDFSDFRAAAGAYWDVERAYKNGLIEQAKAIIARQDDDRAVGESLYRLLSVGGSGLPLSWRTLSEVQNADPELRDRFYTSLGVLARSDGPLEEAVPAAARELEALREAGIAGLRRGEVLSIPITVWATLHPDQASWFKIAKIDEMGRRLFGRRLFPQTEFRDADLAEWLQLMRALLGLLDKEFGWHPHDLFDVQGFIWVVGNPDSPRELDPVPVWMVTSLWGQEDGLPRFVERAEWSLLTDTGSANNRRVREMQVGDRIFLKDFVPRARDLPFDAGTGIMAAATVFLARHTRSLATRRTLDELRHALADIPLMPITRLPWQAVRIDRTNRRWEALFRLARLLLQRDWQATHHHAKAPDGLTLLFPMNDLFEKYIAVLLRRALAGSGIEVIDQGGHRACLGSFTGGHLETGEVFRTKPDIMLRRGREIVAIIDTKWKKLSLDPLDRKHGVSQADVYQLMAYARLYQTAELMLLYPARPGQVCAERAQFGMAGGSERLRIAMADVSLDEKALAEALGVLVMAPAVTKASPLPQAVG